ncbi:MAG: cyclic nucleotide-binding domain-containing protein [Bacteriovoracaceae bacterium]|nr:cyclic nucleotide-binding domain-containing protein [Bacteriovoracaceae bacterium]
MPIALSRRFNHEHVREYQDGDLIFNEGDEDRDLFIIQEGTVQIRKKTQQGELILAELLRGDFFGDMALLQNIPRFASAYSVGKTKVLVLHPGGFLLKIRRDPTFAFEMLQQLSARVKVSSEKFLEAVLNGKMTNEVAEDILNSSSEVLSRDEIK